MSDPRAILAQAEKKATSSGGWFSSGNKYEEAAELFTRAANAFKLAQQWDDSGRAFLRAAEMQIKGGEQDEAANSYWSAAKSFKRSSPELAIQALMRTNEILTQKGRFRQAAQREQEIAEIYKNDAGDLEKALECYERAGEWYLGEDAVATANGMFREAADIAAQLERYDVAVSRYEQVATSSLQSALTKYSVKDYYLKAGLCYIATGDVVAAQRALATYTTQDPSFASTREFKFLSAILDAVEQGDTEAFTAHIVEFDRLSKLDPWKTSLLLKIKKGIQEEPGLA